MSTRKLYEYGQMNITHNEFPVLLLEALVALPQLVGHQLVLVSLLLTRIQLFGQNEQGLLLTLQFALTHQELIPHTHTNTTESTDVIIVRYIVINTVNCTCMYLFLLYHFLQSVMPHGECDCTNHINLNQFHAG